MPYVLGIFQITTAAQNPAHRSDSFAAAAAEVFVGPAAAGLVAAAAGAFAGPAAVAAGLAASAVAEVAAADTAKLVVAGPASDH